MFPHCFRYREEDALKKTTLYGKHSMGLKKKKISRDIRKHCDNLYRGAPFCSNLSYSNNRVLGFTHIS